MRSFTLDQLRDVLDHLGVVSGDTLLVHSSLMHLGAVAGETPEATPSKLLDTLLSVLGPEGTLLVPAFFYEYARSNTPFDTVRSPVSKRLGSFSRHVAAHPQAVRSLNPIFGLAAIGHQAVEICRRDTASAFGVDSPWDMLTRMGGKLLSLGVRPAYSWTFFHYVEQHFGVPYMYTKYYSTPVTDDGKLVNLPVISFVRYLDFGVEVDFSRVEQLGLAENVIASNNIGMSKAYCADARRLFDFCVNCLKKDLWFLVKRQPSFRADEYPCK